jgi:hypothetical protein
MDYCTGRPLRILRGYVAAGLLFTGCAGGSTRVHPRYAELGFPVVGVAEVENQTSVPLVEEETGDLIENVMRGGRKTDVAAVLRTSLIEALARKGYQASAWKPPPAGEQVVLASAITSWDRSGLFRDGRIRIAGSLKLLRLSPERGGGGIDDLLFETTFRYEAGASSAGARTTLEVEKVVRQAGSHALRKLPPASVLKSLSQ